ncbi:MAG: transporter substrate-binding domain-containing protein [Rubrivivax sp.]|nr:MAG: transporter substrate-binding domain-containing protein [Rubrivivax sp.]
MRFRSPPTRLNSARIAAVLALVLASAAGVAQTRTAAGEAGALAAMRIATNVERSYFPPAEALLRKAYASLGLQVEYQALPLTRAQVELRSGRIDVVAMRTEVYFQQTPFVRKVDVPLLNLHVFAYGRPPCAASLLPQDLAGRRISFQRGMVAVETLIPENSRMPANTPSDAFLNLSSGAADFALMLTTPWMAEMPVETRQGTLCRVPTPLGRTTLFHGVHESHAAWVAPLEQALRGLRDRGEIQQAWVDYERQTAVQNVRLQAQPGRSLIATPMPQMPPTQPAAQGSAPAQPPQ